MSFQECIAPFQQGFGLYRDLFGAGNLSVPESPCFRTIGSLQTHTGNLVGSVVAGLGKP